MNILAKTFAAGALAVAGLSLALPAQAQNARYAPGYYPPAAHFEPHGWRATDYPHFYRWDDVKGRYNGFSQSNDGNGYIFN